MSRYLILAAAAAAALCSAPGLASAQTATRTWISGIGDDANACTQNAPCRTFDGAMQKTAANGEVNCLSAGSFGTANITKSITLNCRDVAGGVTTPQAGIGVLVNAGMTDVVVLNGLDIQGGGTGSIGVRIDRAAKVIINGGRVSNMTAAGVRIQPIATTTVEINDTVINNNAGGGVHSRPTGAGFAQIALSGVKLVQNSFGLRAEDSSIVTAVGSSFNGNTNNGVLAFSSGRDVGVMLADSVVANNAVNGVVSVGSGAHIGLANTKIIGNGTGVSFSNGGVVATTAPGTNVIIANRVDGYTNSVMPLR